MQDMVPLGTGNSRFLKSVANIKSLYPDYDAFTEALAAGTFPIDLNGVNPAGVSQTGTALNKANLLSDATGAKCGGASTPNAAFDYLSDGITNMFQIGDIRHTTRTNLGSNWLLCNGASVNPADYPELYSALPSLSPTAARWTDYTETSFTSSISQNANQSGLGLRKAGDYWFLFNASEIYYSSSAFGTWEKVNLDNLVSGGGGLVDIAYGGGYYVVAMNGTNTSYAHIAYATDPGGTWTANSNSTSYTGITGLARGGSYFVITINATSSNLRYSTNGTGSWTAKTVGTAGLRSPVYNGSQWAVIHDASPYVYYSASSSPSGTWSTSNLTTSSSFLSYGNGMWVAMTSGGLAKTSSLSGSWSNMSISRSGTGAWRGAKFCDTFWCFLYNYSGNNNVYYVYAYSDLTAQITGTNSSGQATSYLGGPNNLLEYADGVLATGKKNGTSCSVVYHASKVLPTISPTGAYAYIRAK